MLVIPRLSDLRTAHESAYASLLAMVDNKWPGATIWHWYRALSAINGTIGRHNEDTSNDAAMAADQDVKAAHDEYIRLLHIFYRTRDGEHGVLGRIR